MARTDGIDTHRLQLCQFAVQGILVKSGSQTSEVVMFADTIQFHVLAVEPEARLGIKPEIAESRRGCHLVDYTTIFKYARTNLIYIGALWRPALQGSSVDIHRGFRSGSSSHLLACSIQHTIAHPVVLACHSSLHLDGTRLGVGLDVHTPMFHMHIVSLCQPNMTIDATTGIPTGVGLVAIIDTDSNDIAVATHIARDINYKRAVSVRAVVDNLTIDENDGIHIDTIKLQEVLGHILHIKVFPVPCHATRQRAPTRT